MTESNDERISRGMRLVVEVVTAAALRQDHRVVELLEAAEPEAVRCCALSLVTGFRDQALVIAGSEHRARLQMLSAARTVEKARPKPGSAFGLG